MIQLQLVLLCLLIYPKSFHKQTISVAGETDRKLDLKKDRYLFLIQCYFCRVSYRLEIRFSFNYGINDIISNMILTE